MVARERNLILDRSSGNRWSNNDPGGALGGGMIPTEYLYCGDHTGPDDGQPFYVDKRSTSGGIINKFSDGLFDSQFRDYLCDALRNTANYGHQPVFGVPNDVELSTSAAARTNPSRPYVDVPVNILDLRTRVETLRDDLNDVFRRFPRRYRPYRPRRGDILREAGSSYLEYQFLIRPMVNDIVKLANSSDQVSRRVGAINRLFDVKGLRKTVDTGTFSASGQYGSVVQSSGVFIFQMMDYQTTVETATHIRWRPEFRIDGIPHPPQYVRAWANRAVGGYTIDAYTLWSITPWSWLADWASNTSEYLVASRNIIPAVIDKVLPMRHTTTITQSPGSAFDGGQMTPIRVHQETKERHVSFISPTAHFPFLDAGQMGILGALAAART